jgi:putative transcriptional regulator
MTHEVFVALLEAARARRRRRLARLARAMGAPVPQRLDAADPIDARAVRALSGLSQAKFAELLGVELGTLRNWEQGRRVPTGPARALLRAIRNDPLAVVKALSQ